MRRLSHLAACWVALHVVGCAAPEALNLTVPSGRVAVRRVDRAVTVRVDDDVLQSPRLMARVRELSSTHAVTIDASNQTLRGKTTTDAGAVHLSQLPSIEGLSLARSGVTDVTMEQLAGLDRLRVLDLADARIGDAGLASIATLRQLEELDLSSTAVTDDGLVALRSMAPLHTWVDSTC